MSHVRCDTCQFAPCRCEDLAATYKPLGDKINGRVHVAGVGGEAGWPIKSDAAGVHPSQVPDAIAESIRLGVPTDFDKIGRPILTDATHRRKYLKAIQMQDRQAFC